MSNSTTPAPRKNLLDLALEQERPIWQSGQVVTLVVDRQGRPKAYLKEISHVIHLCTGKDLPTLPTLPVFRLDVDGWMIIPRLPERYAAWAARCQEQIDPQAAAAKRQAEIDAWYRGALGRNA